MSVFRSGLDFCYFSTLGVEEGKQIRMTRIGERVRARCIKIADNKTCPHRYHIVSFLIKYTPFLWGSADYLLKTFKPLFCSSNSSW